jgi:transposase InsO family protein
MGGEYQSKAFIDFCEKKNIKQQLMQARTPQQNGVVEWKNHTFLEKVQTTILSQTCQFSCGLNLSTQPISWQTNL